MSLDAPRAGAAGEGVGGVLVIGYGNTLRSDDGVGWHVAALLAEDPRLAADSPLAVPSSPAADPSLAVPSSPAADIPLAVPSSVAADPSLAADPQPGGDLPLAGVTVLAVHQLTPELAIDMSRASLVILIDASADDPPGSITVRSVADDGNLTAGAAGPSSHHVGPGELLAVARVLYGHAPEALTVHVGVADMGAGESLSPDMAAALPAVADVVIDLVAAHRGSRSARQPDV